MKKVTVIGAGMMAGPLTRYLLDHCNYNVTIVDQVLERAQKIVGNHPKGHPVGIRIHDSHSLDDVIKDADIVLSMVPKPVHPFVAEACLRNGKSMFTTSYETPELLAMADEAREKGLLILNELGEDPGIDHLGTMMLLHSIRKDGGKVIDLKSYGSGLPAFKYNNNPIGYKFSWDPRTLFSASQANAAYYKVGKRLEVPGERLFEEFYYVDIEGLGTFETYPNKDCSKYLIHFGLNPRTASFYRGLLRYPGYCNFMRYLINMGLFDNETTMDFTGNSYRQLSASLVRAKDSDTIEGEISEFLGIDKFADFIHRYRWLGLLDETPVRIPEGTLQDVLLDRMLEKMSYEPHGRDMIIVHIEAVAEFPENKTEKRTATMVVRGIPYGDSAMSRAVGLPIAIAAKLYLEGKIKAAGAHMPPTLPYLYPAILEELADFGFTFTVKQMPCRERRKRERTLPQETLTD